MRIYPIPRELRNNPYFEQLYTPLKDRIELRQLRVKHMLKEVVKTPKDAIIHWHFFDEILQRRSRFETAFRSIGFMLLIKLLKWRGIKQVWTVHNIEPHETLHEAWARRVYRWVGTTMDGIIAHSKTAAQLVREQYEITQPITVMPQGNYINVYGVQHTKTASREKLNLMQDVFIALNIGFIRRYKGLEWLIEAWNGIQGQLLIAGNVKDQTYAQELRAKAAADPSIELTLEFIPDDVLSSWFGAADIIVLPYRKLLTSAVMLNALSYGKPVIAPRVPTVEELITEGKTGFLFDPNQPDSLHKALLKASHHPHLEKLGHQAYELAQQFPWEKSATLLYQVYSDVLNTHTQQE